ncbi:MAG: hypothetical protein B6I25_08615, partial [Planctomycetales bacterium 4572_13]
ANHSDSFSKRYDVDFQVKKCLAELELYDEYVLEIHGKITATEITEETSQHVGHINARLIQMGRIMNDGESVFELYDSFDQYFHEIYGELFDPGSDDFTETLQHQFKELGAGSNVLLIDDVEILPSYRGKRIALAAVHRTIDVFGPYDCLVIIPIYPPQFGEHRDNAEWKKKMLTDSFVKNGEDARAKLEQYWCLLGFERIWDSRYICALCTNNKYPPLEDVCPEFGYDS